MKKLILYAILACTIGFNASAQQYNKLYDALDQNPTPAYLELRGNEQELIDLKKNKAQLQNIKGVKISGFVDKQLLNKFFKTLSDMEKIHTLWLQGNNLKRTPSAIGQLKSVGKIKLKGSPDLKMRDFIGDVKDLPELKELQLLDNGFYNLPRNIRHLESLEKLTINGNRQFNYYQAIRRMENLPGLKELSLANDEITELPGNIGDLTQLEVLDLRNNRISRLPEEIAQLRNLRELRLAGNLMVDPLEQMAKVERLNLDLLSVDDSQMTKEQKDALNRMFASAQIASEQSETETFNLYESSPSLSAKREKHEQRLQKSMEADLKKSPSEKQRETDSLLARKMALQDEVAQLQKQARYAKKKKQSGREVEQTAGVKAIKTAGNSANSNMRAEDKGVMLSEVNVRDRNQQSENQIAKASPEMTAETEADISAPEKSNEKRPAENELTASASGETGFKWRNKVIKENGSVMPLSNAYLKYPDLFDPEKFAYQFDTTSFHDRYLDTSYANTNRQHPHKNFKKISLELYDDPKGDQIWFDFVREQDFRKYLIYNNPEINAFGDMKWVYNGPMTEREFKRFIRKNKWTDFRLHYKNEDKSFVMELKSEDGFDRISTYPRFKSHKTPLLHSEETYVDRYQEYLKILERREQNFNEELQRKKREYDQMLAEMKDMAWKTLRTYMSEQEKSLSRDEWLEYFDHLVAHKDQDVNELAKLEISELMKNLQNKGYQRISHFNKMVKDENHKGLEQRQVEFVNSQNEFLPVKKIHVLNHDKKTIFTFNGSFGVQPAEIYYNPDAHNSMVLELRNGNLALMNSKDFAEGVCKKATDGNFPVKILEKKKHTLGDVQNYLPL